MFTEVGGVLVALDALDEVDEGGLLVGVGEELDGVAQTVGGEDGLAGRVGEVVEPDLVDGGAGTVSAGVVAVDEGAEHGGGGDDDAACGEQLGCLAELAACAEGAVRSAVCADVLEGAPGAGAV